MDKRVDECKKMLQRLAYTSKGWRSGQNGSIRVASAMVSDALNLIIQQMKMLNHKVDSLSLVMVPKESLNLSLKILIMYINKSRCYCLIVLCDTLRSVAKSLICVRHEFKKYI